MAHIPRYVARSPGIDPRSQAALIEIGFINDAAFPFISGAAETLCGFEFGPGEGCDVALTTDTLADFATARLVSWAARGDIHHYPNGSYPGMHITRCKRAEGSEPEDLFVMDIGRKRVVLSRNSGDI